MKKLELREITQNEPTIRAGVAKIPTCPNHPSAPNVPKFPLTPRLPGKIPAVIVWRSVICDF